MFPYKLSLLMSSNGSASKFPSRIVNVLGNLAYLKEENRILRSRLPKQVNVTAKTRQRLIKMGKKLGAQLKELISIGSDGSFLRWIREATGQTPIQGKRKPGCPRTPDQIQERVLKLARENDWGYTRILGELRKLGLRKICRQTVKNILKAHGLDLGPERGKGTWDEFLNSHQQTLWQCDFATKRMWTLRGIVDVYFLVFIHLGTRRCWISPSTVHPDNPWTCQQARNFLMHADDVMLPPKYVLRDNDVKYPKAFDDVFKASDAEVVRNTPRSPNLRAHVERFIQTHQNEVLHKFVVVSEQHLNHINREYQHWYNHDRPHSARDHLPPGPESPPVEVETFQVKDLVCELKLGGVLKSYSWRAA